MPIAQTTVWVPDLQPPGLWVSLDLGGGALYPGAIPPLHHLLGVSYNLCLLLPWLDKAVREGSGGGWGRECLLLTLLVPRASGPLPIFPSSSSTALTLPSSGSPGLSSFLVIVPHEVGFIPVLSSGHSALNVIALSKSLGIVGLLHLTGKGAEAQRGQPT